MSTNGKTLKFRAAKLKGFTVYPIFGECIRSRSGHLRNPEICSCVAEKYWNLPFHYTATVTAQLLGDSSISQMPGYGPNALPKNWI